MFFYRRIASIGFCVESFVIGIIELIIATPRLSAVIMPNIKIINNVDIFFIKSFTEINFPNNYDKIRFFVILFFAKNLVDIYKII